MSVVAVSLKKKSKEGEAEKSRSFLPRTSPTFFFQAEDGIRDADVTGVQTCALPIWVRGSASTVRAMGSWYRASTPRTRDGALPIGSRSEERRVGKECRSRWSPY